MSRPVFNLPYNKAYTAGSEFKTEILDEDTVNEQRNSLWDTDKLSLTIVCDKSPATFVVWLAFWRTCKGKAIAFDFTWGTDRGGDGVTRIMRFDTDKLDFKVDWIKFKNFTVPIKETIDDA